MAAAAHKRMVCEFGLWAVTTTPPDAGGDTRRPAHGRSGAACYSAEMAVVAIAFDTHRFVKRLTGAGMDERQAEVLADEQVGLLNANLATKAELAAVEANLQAKITQVEASIAEAEGRLGEKIATVEANLLRWMVGTLIAQAGVIVGLLRLLS